MLGSNLSNIKAKRKNQSQILFIKIKTPFGAWPLSGRGSAGGTRTRPCANRRTTASRSRQRLDCSPDVLCRTDP